MMISEKEIIKILTKVFNLHIYGVSGVFKNDLPFIAKQIISKLPKLKLLIAGNIVDNFIETKEDGLRVLTDFQMGSEIFQILKKRYYNKNIKIYVEIVDEKGKIPRNGRV